MPPDADPGNAEREDEVEDHVEADLRGELLEAAVPRHDERRRHEAEDRARRSHRGLVGVQQQGAERAREERDEVDGDEAGRADRGLEQRAEDEQREHVERDVDDPGVEEASRDDPPPVTIRHRGRVEPRVVDHAAARSLKRSCAAPAHQLGDERGDVDGDQRVCGGRRSRLQTRADATNLRALARALRAPHADGGDRHAVGADRAPAVRAGHVRRATGMAIALGHGAREATGRSSGAEGVRAGVGPQVRPRVAG